MNARLLLRPVLGVVGVAVLGALATVFGARLRTQLLQQTLEQAEGPTAVRTDVVLVRLSPDLAARVLEQMANADTPIPAEAATPTPTPTPTEEASPPALPSPAPTPEVSPTPTAEATPTPTAGETVGSGGETAGPGGTATEGGVVQEAQTGGSLGVLAGTTAAERVASASEVLPLFGELAADVKPVLPATEEAVRAAARSRSAPGRLFARVFQPEAGALEPMERWFEVSVRGVPSYTVPVSSSKNLEPAEGTAPPEAGDTLRPGGSEPAGPVTAEAAAALTETKEAIARLRDLPGVERVDPVLVYNPAAAPNDPFFASSGSWGQPYRDLWGLEKIQAERAWDVTTGSPGVVIAVIDTGLDISHRDLQGNVWTNPGEIPGNGLDDDRNGYVDDVNGWNFYLDTNDISDPCGHGTRVAGVIAARGNNATDIVGVMWEGKILPLAVLQHTGSCGGFDVDLAASLVYAADASAKVANMSLGGYGYSAIVHDAVRYAASRGVLSVAANGNDDLFTDENPHYPASLPEVMAVGATGTDDARTVNVLWSSNYGTDLEVVAPGGGAPPHPQVDASEINILSLHSSRAPPRPDLQVGETLRRSWGTSLAAPYASGLAGLLFALHPTKTAEDIRAIIRDTADDLGEPGQDAFHGFGRINAARAVGAAPAPPPPPPPPPPTGAECVGIEAPDTLAVGEAFTPRVLIRNTGTAIWQPSGAQRVKLWSVRPPGKNRWGVVGRLLPRAIAPGEIAEFSFNFLNAPLSPGTYPFAWQMGTQPTAAGLFGQVCEKPIAVTGTPPSRDRALTAACVDPFIVDAPRDVTVGDTFTASFRMKNVGTQTWPAGVSPIRLAPPPPPTWTVPDWGVREVALPNAVASRKIVTFTITARAPEIPPGRERWSQNFAWQLHDGTQPFGEVCSTAIMVHAQPSAPPPPPPPDGGGGGGGGGGSGGGEAPSVAEPAPRVHLIQAERARRIGGSTVTTVLREAGRTVVSLAVPTAAVESTVSVPAATYRLEVIAKHHQEGTVRVTVLLNGRAWRSALLTRRDGRYRAAAVGTLRGYSGGKITIRARLTDAGGRTRPVSIDAWRLVPVGE